jgi:hypothetical protein
MNPNKWIALAVTALLTIPANAKMEVHEWGTFTSLVGSDGLTQHGMYHEDEVLPSFVHPFGKTQSAPPDIVPFPNPNPGTDPCFNFKTCFSMQTLSNNVISQKMETPVIYFYGQPSSANQRVKVNVRFPEGVITETYPAPILSSPQNNSGFVAIKNGDVTFDVQVFPETNSSAAPAVEANNIYSHARLTNSHLVKTNSETEKFIFYRGLGRFQPRLSILSSENGLYIGSTAADKPQAAFLIGVTADGSHIQMYKLKADQIAAKGIGETIPANIADNLASTFPFPNKNVEVSKSAIKSTIVQALQSAGMFLDEAHAMVNTWENGYLKTPGLRLLYILPRAEVDAILPITLTPAADKLERAFIARIEILTNKEEQTILANIIRDGMNYDIEQLGRFAEPKLRRVQNVYMTQKLNHDPKVLAALNHLIQQSITFSESASTVTH